ncbi:hypothetical protein LP419_10725 [Massilia sp. H-1]|nr:hypothetical protein LP419_10725 [Massilia sp. H-1]
MRNTRTAVVTLTFSERIRVRTDGRRSSAVNTPASIWAASLCAIWR